MWYRGRFALTADGRIMKWGMKNGQPQTRQKKRQQKWNISWEKRIFAHGTIKNKKISFLNL